MQLNTLNKQLEALGNRDIDFFMKQVENLNSKTDVEIVFSGTVANGKTTLINGLLGINLLPMNVGATTTYITYIQQGSDVIEAILSNGTIQKFPLSKESIESISQMDGVSAINITMESFPYKGVRFVDTPGINDISEDRAERTYEYAPLADAVVFVIDVSKGLTKEESEFFEKKIVKANKDKIFIVLNKIDAIEDEIVPTKLLSEEIAKEYSIYQISALKYLAGKLNSDKIKIEESGTQLFKDDLVNYLENLDKTKIIHKRLEKSLQAIKKLSLAQLDSFIENASKNKPDIEKEIENADKRLEEAQERVALLNQEITDSVVEVGSCVKTYLDKLEADIIDVVNDVPNKEFMIDKFKEEVPRLCKQAVRDIQQCSEKHFKSLSVDFPEMNDILLYIIRHIDDIIVNLVYVLAFIPKVGKFIKPFIPEIQESVRRVVDMFGGQYIASEVEGKIGDVLNGIEEQIMNSINLYQKELMEEAEHNELGAIRAEIISLETLKEMSSEQKSMIDSKVEYFQKKKVLIGEMIDEVIVDAE